MNLRRLQAAAAAALVAASLLAPAQALAIPRFGGGAFKGGAHGAPHEAPPPGPHEGPLGARAGGSAGAHPFEPPPRAAEPEWLRPAHDQAAEQLKASAADDTLHRQAEAAAQQAAGAGDTTIEPWPNWPNLKVRVTGRPQVDLPRLTRLADRLAQPLDPNRIRSTSLADDVSADSLLFGQGRGASTPERQWAQAMRRLRPDQVSDPAALADLMRPLQGELLMLMAHIDAQHQALVFRGADGRPRQVSVQALEQAADAAGVQLLLVGCKSGRMARAGFADNLNSLDAARAMLRAQAVRPANAFELLGALSGPDMKLLLDPQAFLTLNQATLHAAEPGPALSTLHWLGAGGGAAVAAVAAIAGGPPAAGSDSAGGSRREAFARALAPPAVAGVLALVGLSWLVSVVRAWRRRQNGQDFAHRLLWSAGLHLGLPPLWLAAWAEAVGGADARGWSWGGAALGLLGWAWWTRRAWRSQPATTPDPASAAGPGRDRWGHRSHWLRWTVATLPFVVTVLAREGWAQPSGAVQEVLRAWYRLGSLLPAPLDVAGTLVALVVVLYGAIAVLFLVVASVWVVAAAPWRGVLALRARHARRAQWRAQLAEVGVSDTRAAVRARACLHAELPQDARWDRLETVTRFGAPDPWAGQRPQRWLLWKLPLAGDQAAWGLMRQGSAFPHPLPQAMVQRWQDQQVQTDELPGLLARVQHRLRRGDFVTPARPRRIPLAWPACGLVLAWLWWQAAEVAPPAHRWVFVDLALVSLALMWLWPWLRWVRERWHLAWLLRQRGQPPVAAAAA